MNRCAPQHATQMADPPPSLKQPPLGDILVDIGRFWTCREASLPVGRGFVRPGGKQRWRHCDPRHLLGQCHPKGSGIRPRVPRRFRLVPHRRQVQTKRKQNHPGRHPHGKNAIPNVDLAQATAFSSFNTEQMPRDWFGHLLTRMSQSPKPSTRFVHCLTRISLSPLF